MKKIWLPVAILLVLLVGVGFLYVKLNPPLSAIIAGGVPVSNELIVEVKNNHSFGSIKITNVLVNNGEKTGDVKIQVSNQVDGFFTRESLDDTRGSVAFQDLATVKIKKVSGNRGSETLANNNEIYAVMLRHVNKIESLEIEYKYLGFTYKKTVTVI